VLDEVRAPAKPVVLVPRAHSEHQHQARGGTVRHGRGHETSAAFQGADGELIDAHPSASIASRLEVPERTQPVG